MLHRKAVQRFTQLLLDEGEDYVLDYNCFCHSKDILHNSSPGYRGKLRLCSKSIFFEAEDISVPLLRFPFSELEECAPGGNKLLKIRTKAYTCMKAHNLDRPYEHVRLASAVEVSLMLEFDTMQTLMLNLTEVLTINRNPNISQREEELKEWSKKRAQQARFDFSRLLDSFGERVLLDCFVRNHTPLVRQPGRLVITDQCLYFQPLHSISGDSVPRVHSLRAIAAVARRRSAMRPIGIEVFMMTSPDVVPLDQSWGAPSALFTFESRDMRERVHELLMSQPKLGAAVPGTSALQRGALLEGRGAWLLHIQSAWLQGRLCNMDYLLYLNLAAGRSFNDLAQWPVFPWVLADYESPRLDLDSDASFRDLSKPMGALGDPGRLQEFRQRFKETSELHRKDPRADPGFMYGSHYSTPGYVMFWLVRTAPEQMLRLQNGRFDSPDRLFFSVAQAWRSCVGHSMTDLKELIPEFFLPGGAEFLVNSKNLPLGRRQNGRVVGDVELPPWASSAEDFLQKNRAALEAPYVQRHLHEWINLIFGYKQRGPAAAAADNVFRHTSYEGAVDLDAISDPVERVAKEMMISEFGQTPSQLFENPHPPRLVITPHYTPAPEPFPAPRRSGSGTVSATGQTLSLALVHIVLAAASTEPVRNALTTAESRGNSVPGTPVRTPLFASTFNGAMDRGGGLGPSAPGTPVWGSAPGSPTLQGTPARTPFVPVRFAETKAEAKGGGVEQGDAGGAYDGAWTLEDELARAADAPASPCGSEKSSNSDLKPATVRFDQDSHRDADIASPHTPSTQPRGRSDSPDGTTSPLAGCQPGQAPSSGQPLFSEATPTLSALERLGAVRPAESALRPEHQPLAESGLRLLTQPTGAAAAPLAPPIGDKNLTLPTPAAAPIPDPAADALFALPSLHIRNVRAAAPDAAADSCTRQPSGAVRDMGGEDPAEDLWPADLHTSLRVAHLLQLQRDEVKAVAADADAVASGSAGGTLRLHSARNAALQRSCKLPRASPIFSLAFLRPPPTAAAPTLVLAGTYSTVHAYCVDFGTVTGSFVAHGDCVSALGLGPCSGVGSDVGLFTAGHDTTVKIWALAEGRQPWECTAPPVAEVECPHGSVPLCMQAHPTTGQFAVGTDSGTVAVWDARSSDPIWEHTFPPASIRGVAPLPTIDSLQALVTAGADGRLRLLDLRRNGASSVLADVQRPEALSCCITDGCVVLAGTNEGGLLAWNLDPVSDKGTEGVQGTASAGAGRAFPCRAPDAAVGGVECLCRVGGEGGDSPRSVQFASGHAQGYLCLYGVEA